MSSKGSPIIPIRLTPEMLQRVEMCIRRNNRTRVEEPWNRTSWIVDAIVRKLEHQERAKRQRRRRHAMPIQDLLSASSGDGLSLETQMNVTS